MKHNVIVHIGGSKCGSSAIQTFLKNNAKLLLKQSVYVPTANMLPNAELTGQQIWYFQNMYDDIETHGARFRNRVDEYFKERNVETTLILSAENLSNLNNLEGVFKGLEEKYNFKIICYIRRQDDYLMSAWQQWHLKTNPDFWSWCIHQLGTCANWQKAIEPWVAAFGKEACNIRIFERDLMVEQDINVDFCAQAGIARGGLDFDIGIVNPSYNQAIEKLAESANFLFNDMHDNRFYEMIGKLTGSHHFKRSGEVSLTRVQRISILKSYEESNNWVKETFFPDMGRKELFSHVRALSYKHPSRTLEQEKEAVLIDLIFQLYRKLDK